MAPKQEQIEVVWFRVPQNLMEQFDRIAQIEKRPRASMLRAVMENSVNAVATLTRNLEAQVKLMADLERMSPNSPQLEYYRGQLHAVKALLVTFVGERTKNYILEKVRKKTGLPIPHIVPLAPDGNRYGFDSDAG